MNKYPLIGGSILAVVLLVLASLTNVVGYQTVEASNQKIINSEVNEKELLFQIIVDMANNKEIQKLILGSEITGKRFFNHDMRFLTFTFPIITERFLKRIYTMGVVLFRTLSNSKMQSIIEQYHKVNQGILKELSTVIQKDFRLKDEVTQLSNLKCDCKKESTTLSWSFPIICSITLILALLVTNLIMYNPFIQEHEIFLVIIVILHIILLTTAEVLQCWWFPHLDI